MSKLNDKLAEAIVDKLLTQNLVKNDHTILQKLKTSKISEEDWRVLLEEKIYFPEQPKINKNAIKKP